MMGEGVLRTFQPSDYSPEFPSELTIINNPDDEIYHGSSPIKLGSTTPKRTISEYTNGEFSFKAVAEICRFTNKVQSLSLRAMHSQSLSLSLDIVFIASVRIAEGFASKSPGSTISDLVSWKVPLLI
jgi:hypothetical protein